MPPLSQPLGALPPSERGWSCMSQVVTGDEKSAFPVHAQDGLQQSQNLVVKPAVSWVRMVPAAATMRNKTEIRLMMQL